PYSVVGSIAPPKSRGPIARLPRGQGVGAPQRTDVFSLCRDGCSKAKMVRSVNMMTTTAVVGGMRVAVLMLLFACEEMIPLAAGFLAPVPASSTSTQHQRQLLLPAVTSSHAERRPCRCRHATPPAAEQALTAFNRREREACSRRHQRVPVSCRTTTTTTTTTSAASAVSCRASREDASPASPATDSSRPHDAGA
ncbi:unnamed protein product, partial [Laminaria digitata]